VKPLPLARVLVVDDETPLVSALCRALTSRGYEATGAASGPEALSLLRAAAVDRSKSFDLLITDLMMPDMDGVALLRAASQIDRDLVGLVMTGHGTIDTAVDAMKSGALDYILKPFNLNTILPALSRALTVRRLRLENAALVERVANRTTELEGANRRLQSVNKELEAFTHSVSHDLRQPLNGIIGCAEFLATGKLGLLNEKQKEYLGHICSSGQQLLQLSEDLLEFSRLGQQALKRRSVNVEAVVLELVQQLREAEPQRNVEVRVGTLPRAEADPSLLRQVLVNLLSNAFKFTRHVPDAVIEVDGRREPGECTYSVRDNGVGFDMSNAPRLFTIFHRLHSASDFEGTGVGLSIVQRIVERHGGRVWADAAVGKGAQFTFTLPYTDSPPPATDSSS
jgi:signal transduction histidine kinase